MENRSGLCADLQITDPRMSEPKVAQRLLARLRRKRIHARTLGADKGYHSKAFVEHLREHGVRPHIARIDGRRTPGLDGRTTRHASYRASQRTRKRIEEIFGWLKTVGGMRRSRVMVGRGTGRGAWRPRRKGDPNGCNHPAFGMTPLDRCSPCVLRHPVR
jgi:IS5 family transposase